MVPLQVLTLQFANKISEKEIQYLRGVAIAATQRQSVLFHNHIDEELRYSYPLVQYKRIDGKAAIVFVGDACQQVPLFLDGFKEEVRLGLRPVRLQIEDMQQNQGSMVIGTEGHYYRFSDWLPLNGLNFHRFEELETLSEKIELLESLITGNILSMAKGLNIFLEDRFVVKLTDLSVPRRTGFKGTTMLSMDGEFVTNIDLPSDIGLGKGASIGHGTIKKLYK